MTCSESKGECWESKGEVLGEHGQSVMRAWAKHKQRYEAQPLPTEVRLDGRCDGGLGQQRNDGGRCATTERWE